MPPEAALDAPVTKGMCRPDDDDDVEEEEEENDDRVGAGAGGVGEGLLTGAKSGTTTPGDRWVLEEEDRERCGGREGASAGEE